jgi:hypothetical protein
MTTRMTRAQRAQQNVDQLDDAADLKERAPLNEISPNPSPERLVPEEELPKKTPVKGKSKKGAKGKQAKATKQEEEQAGALLEDEKQAAEGLASDAAIADVSQDPSGGE